MRKLALVTVFAAGPVLAQVGAWVKNELARWTPIIKATGIKTD